MFNISNSNSFISREASGRIRARAIVIQLLNTAKSTTAAPSIAFNTLFLMAGPRLQRLLASTDALALLGITYMSSQPKSLLGPLMKTLMIMDLLTKWSRRHYK